MELRPLDVPLRDKAGRRAAAPKATKAKKKNYTVHIGYVHIPGKQWLTQQQR